MISNPKIMTLRNLAFCLVTFQLQWVIITGKLNFDDRPLGSELE